MQSSLSRAVRKATTAVAFWRHQRMPRFFYATVDDQSHCSLDHPATHRITQLAPVLIGTNPRTLVLQIRDRFLDALTCLGWQSCGQGAQALQRLIDLSVPQPRPMHEQLIVSFSR